MDRDVWDNENRLLYGDSNFVQQEFDATTLTFEQRLLDGNAGVEITIDRQDWTLTDFLNFSTGASGGFGTQNDIYVDVSEYLADDTPNPNVGRPFVMSALGTNGLKDAQRKASRVTAFYDLDFSEINDNWKWLGRHVFTGLLNRQEIDTTDRNFRKAWVSDEVDFPLDFRADPLRQFRRSAIQMVYIGPSLLDPSFNSLSDLATIDLESLYIPTLEEGDAYNVSYFSLADRQMKEGVVGVRDFLGGANRRWNRIDTEAFSVQSYLFDGNLVGLAGWRTDEQLSRVHSGNAQTPEGEFDEANLVLGEERVKETGDTFTWSLVGHVPIRLPGDTELSVHYNESENFQPVGQRRTVWGDLLSPPTGSTKDYGFTLASADNRYFIRFNWFETASENIGAGLGNSALSTIGAGIRNYMDPVLELNDADFDAWVAGTGAEGRYSTWSEVSNAFLAAIPARIQEVQNYRVVDGTLLFDPIVGSTITAARSAEGFEIDLVGNPTPNWRVALNVGQQETVQSDTAPLYAALVEEVSQNVIAAGLDDVGIYPNIGGLLGTYRQAFTTSTLNPLTAALVKDGSIVAEQREWRVNLMTNYGFTEGFLKNAEIGGALRWQDEAAIGYPISVNADGIQIPDLSNPFLAPSEFNGDLWLGYGKNLTDKVDWKIQLNVRNAFGDSDSIPVLVNPDGKLAVIRNPNPMEVFITNTFSF
ncbi:MAG: hypothetical protein KJT03_10735, partial [Verrucomicrobiae bacterium]|nr:hypothetical protein [Verrucomicrobiae bacterium]